MCAWDVFVCSNIKSIEIQYHMCVCVCLPVYVSYVQYKTLNSRVRVLMLYTCELNSITYALSLAWRCLRLWSIVRSIVRGTHERPFFGELPHHHRNVLYLTYSIHWRTVHYSPKSCARTSFHIVRDSACRPSLSVFAAVFTTHPLWYTSFASRPCESVRHCGRPPHPVPNLRHANENTHTHIHICAGARRLHTLTPCVGFSSAWRLCRMCVCLFLCFSQCTDIHSNTLHMYVQYVIYSHICQLVWAPLSFYLSLSLDLSVPLFLGIFYIILLLYNVLDGRRICTWDQTIYALGMCVLSRAFHS